MLDNPQKSRESGTTIILTIGLSLVFAGGLAMYFGFVLLSIILGLVGGLGALIAMARAVSDEKEG